MEGIPNQNTSEENIDEGVEGTDHELKKQLEKSKPFNVDEFLKKQGMSDDELKDKKETKLDEFGQIIPEDQK